MHVKEAQKTFAGVTIPWLCDNMSNDLKHALGGLNNPEFVFNPDGEIVRLRDWSSPSDLRADLESLVGPVANPTDVDSLKLQFVNAPGAAERGVVARLDVPEPLQPIKVTSNRDGENPFYVKLRAKSDDALLASGEGKLYLGFHLDPIYRVHWNNLVAPVEFEMRPVDGIHISPLKGKGPKVEVDSDIDPREFLVDVKGASSETRVELTVRYFACNDDEGWCKPVSQSYVIHFVRDPNAGLVREREWSGGRGPGGPGFGGGGRPPQFGGFQGGPPGGFSVDRLFRFDLDGDDQVSKAELPAFLRERILGRIDANQDGIIDRKETEAIGRETP